MNIGILLLRLAVGLTMGAHGVQKLTTWLGGHGIAGTSHFVESLGFRPGRFFAYLLGLSELIGGLLIAVGLMTPLGALVVIGVMTAAAIAVHRGKGFFVTDGGFEYPFILAAASAAIAFMGPGLYSGDSLLGLPVNDPLLAVGTVALGVLSGFAVCAFRHLPEMFRGEGAQAQAG